MHSIRGEIDKAKFYEHQKTLQEMLDQIQERLDFKFEVN